MEKLSTVDWIALGLTIVGGLNWGFVALSHMDLVSMILGEMSIASKGVYGLVALASIYTIILSLKLEKK